MKEAKKKSLERAGWRVGSASELLGLSEQETALIELKLLLAQGIRARREKQGLTQNDLAERLGSSQSRVAKMEAPSADVSLDLLVRGLLALGITRQQLGRMIGKTRSAA